MREASTSGRPLGKRDLLTLQNYGRDEIREMLDLARRVKGDWRKCREVLDGKILGMIFEKPSTRTRLSFEVAMKQLGGDAIYLGWDQLQLGRGETIEDTAMVLSRYVDGVMARVHRHGDLERLSDGSSIPVMNGLSDRFHPCQALADLLTVWEALGRLEDLKIAYVGDGNNVCNSLLIGASKLGLDISVASPEGYAPAGDIIESAMTNAEISGSDVRVMDDPPSAVWGADVVYTDTFVSMGMEEEREERLGSFLPLYRVDEELMGATGRESYFMHCLPAHRGEEVTSGVLDGPRSLVWEQAENRVHAQKAVLLRLLGRT